MDGRALRSVKNVFGILPRYSMTFSRVTPDLFPHTVFHYTELTSSFLNGVLSRFGRIGSALERPTFRLRFLRQIVLVYGTPGIRCLHYT